MRAVRAALGASRPAPPARTQRERLVRVARTYPTEAPGRTRPPRERDQVGHAVALLTLSLTLTLTLALALTRSARRAVTCPGCGAARRPTWAVAYCSRRTKLTRVRYLTPGASVGYVRATRTRLPRWVRTGGAGRLAPRAARTARTGYAYQPRPYRTYRVPWHPSGSGWLVTTSVSAGTGEPYVPRRGWLIIT